MNNIFAVATKTALLIFFSLVCVGAFAQQDDDFIIIEDSSTTSKSGDAKPDSSSSISFSGEAIGSYAGIIAASERYLGSLKLRYFQEFNENFSVVVEGRGYTSTVKLDLNISGSDASQGGNVSRTITATTLELNEAYFRFNKGIIDFYLGRRKLVLGQFDIFSPVDFVLPIDLSNSQINFTKLERRYPQTMASLYLYPNPKLELQLHYLPFIERDPISERLLENSVDYFNGRETATAPFRRPKNTEQYLARAVYTGEKFTAGATYYKGFALIPAARERIVVESGRTTILPEPSYPSFTGYGFEISIPIKRVLFKYEAMVGQFNEALNPCFGTSPACVQYSNFVQNRLGGRLYTNSKFLIHAIGYSFLGEKWTVNLAVFHLADLANSTEKTAQQLSADLINDSATDIVVLPSGNIARHWGRNKAHTTGFAGGFFGASFGASVYHAYKINDNLTALFAVEVLAYISDANFEEQVEADEKAAAGPDSNVRVQLDDIIVPAIRLGFTYRF